MQKVRLIFKGISEIVEKQDVSLLILTDEEEARQLTIICDRRTEYEFERRIGGTENTSTQLPEAMCAVFPELRRGMYEIIITSVHAGKYQTMICNKVDLSASPIDAASGILLALVAGMDIYIDRKLLERQSVPHNPMGGGMPIPVNVLSDEMLQQALDKAVADENYELASVLRDEQDSRVAREKRSQKGTK